jgi:hypothetical protein
MQPTQDSVGAKALPTILFTNCDANITVGQRQITHARQRVWVFLPEHTLHRLHHLYLQLLRLLPSWIPVGRRQIIHAR